MNRMKEVAQLLGVELGEFFRIKGTGEIFRFTTRGLIDKENKICSDTMRNLLIGIFEIEKLPFKPKFKDTYWYFDRDGSANRFWVDCAFDYALYNVRNCFRTCEEAETKGKALFEYMKKRYESEDRS